MVREGGLFGWGGGVLTGRSAAFLGERRYAHPPLPTPSNPQSPPQVPQGAVSLTQAQTQVSFGPLAPPPPPTQPRPPQNQPDVSGEKLVQTLQQRLTRVCLCACVKSLTCTHSLSDTHTHTPLRTSIRCACRNPGFRIYNNKSPPLR